MGEIHNLDEGVSEYFEFKIKGHTYRFRHLTTEEMIEVSKFQEAEPTKAVEYLMQFISKVDDKSPDFEEIFKKMTLPVVRNFNAMIKSEFGQ